MLLLFLDFNFAQPFRHARRAYITVFVLFFSSCVTTSKKENPYQFPNAFSAEQVVKAYDGSKEFMVLGKIERKGRDFHFEFAEPILGINLVTAKVVDSKSEIVWNTGYQPSQFDAQRVVDALVKLYQSESTEKAAGLFEYETSPVKFELSQFDSSAPKCAFPMNIRATSPLKEIAWITFDTKKINCDSDQNKL